MKLASAGTPGRAKTIYVVGPFRLDEDAELLMRDAEPVALGRRAVAVLRVLITQHGRLVSKRDLMDAVWKGHAEESNLTVQITALRRALAEAPGGENWIQTHAGRGYRFVGPSVTKEETSVGESIDDLSPRHQHDVASATGVNAERRQVTIMACELAGDSCAGSVDLEDLRDALDVYRRDVAAACAAFNGIVADCIANTLLVCFGYPAASEHNADHAIRAGLELRGSYPRSRAAIVTGEVIVSELVDVGGIKRPAIVGPGASLATSLLAHAKPGTVTMDATTKRIVGETFDCRALVPLTQDALPAWQVLARSAVDGRFEALHAATLTTPIGRDDEIQLLRRLWSRAKSGAGQVVLIVGEPGIGKSRLLRELHSITGDARHAQINFHCSPFHESSVLFPFALQLERSAGFASEDSTDVRLGKLSSLLSQTPNIAPEALTLFADLLSLSTERGSPAIVPDSQQKRDRTLRALAQRFVLLSAEQPLLATVEDAHWIDSTSLDALSMIVERAQETKTLLVVTCRPEFQAPWRAAPHVSTITLGRLGRDDTSAMIEQIAAEHILPDAVIDGIADRSDGIPLFVEELTRALIESNAVARHGVPEASAARTPPALPASLHDSLMSRLDRLGDAREVAQFGSVLGREFSYGLLAALAGWPQMQLRDALDRLVQAGLFIRRGDLPRGSYVFKHALIQDAAYSTMLRGQLQQLHARAAQLLATQSPEMVARQPEILAHHYTRANLAEPAIDSWYQAGCRALRDSATVEAVRHLRRGLDLIPSLPPGEQRDRKELALCLALGQATWTIDGHGSTTLKVYRRACDLLGRNATAEERMTALVGLWRVKVHRGELVAALGLARQCLALPIDRARPEMSAHANRLLGMTLYFMGRFVDARLHLEKAIDLYAACEDGVSALTVFAADHAFSMLSLTLWALGLPDQAREAADRAVKRASDVGHAVPIAVARVHTVSLDAELGRDISSSADEVAAFCIEHDVKMFVPWARFNQGIAAVRAGQVDRGIEIIRSVMTDAQKIDTFVSSPLHFAHLAIAHARRGEFDLGLALLDEGLNRIEANSERVCQAELHRHHGELLLKLGRFDDAERSLVAALTVARDQHALMLELRAATALARHWRDSGRHAQAHDLLAPVVDRFCEGFDTIDLKEANMLLSDLGSSQDVARRRPNAHKRASISRQRSSRP